MKIQPGEEFLIQTDDVRPVLTRNTDLERRACSGFVSRPGGAIRGKSMRDTFLKTWIRFRHCDKGVTLVEYGIAIALAITLGTAALAALATSVGTSMGNAGALMP